MASKNAVNLTTNLFGLPYQYPPAVDPRVSVINDEIGEHYVETIMAQAPIVTIIPGNPCYLPAASGAAKKSISQAFLESASGNFDAITKLFKGDIKADDLRLYDFKSAYTEYMNYVNILCRAGATFLNLKDTTDGLGMSTTFQHYDWKAYRWNRNARTALIKRIGKNLGKGFDYVFTSKDSNADKGLVQDLFKNYNYVQFYCDPDSGMSEGISNSTGDSMMKSAMDSISSTSNEIQFMIKSGGIDAKQAQDFIVGSGKELASGINSIIGEFAPSVAAPIQRILNAGTEVIKGQNFIIPDIYTGSNYSKSYTITVHLKTPYGTKLGYYLDIFVPMMHLLALALPRQASSNTYESPFLVKAYVNGFFSCNLGIVDSLSISKVSTSLNSSGLPNEVDVTLNITDLYSDLMMTPSSSPIQFANNTSLIEYLATNCGLDLTAPNFKTKWDNIMNSTVNAVTDIPRSFISTMNEKLGNAWSELTNLL